METKNRHNDTRLILNFLQEVDFNDILLKYVNFDWNLLMDLIDKIESLGYEVEIKGINCRIKELFKDEPIVSWVLGDRSMKKELVWTAVVEFIKWYNNEKK